DNVDALKSRVKIYSKLNRNEEKQADLHKILLIEEKRKYENSYNDLVRSLEV
ncbi:8341_t:CDS:1, partial [Cetraspora pellucida]